MEENKSPQKSGRAARSAGGKGSSKGQKEASSQRDGGKGGGRNKEGVSRVREEGQGGHGGGGRTLTGSPQDQGRSGKSRRLTGRTNSGERGKGRPGGHQAEGRQQGQDRGPVGRSGAARGPAANQGMLSLNLQENSAHSKQFKPAAAKDKQMSEVSGRRPVECIQEVMGSDEGNLTSDQQLGLKQAEERLQRDYIHRLAKQSPEYPNFQYLCKLCSVHVDNIQGAHKHIKEKRHKKNIMEKQEENELRALPAPSPAQMRAVDAAVMEAARQNGISEEEFQQRQGVLKRMQQIIQKHLPTCSLRLYGSCLTRFAFKTSDLNIDVAYPPNMTQPDVLIQVLDILKKSAEFSEVESDFHAKVPVVFCRDAASGLPCKVSAGNDVACLTTNHLAALARLEPRLVPLVLAFRYWAKLCHVDCQAEGGIPSYSFSLMVIFFLQQRKQPILPVYLGCWIDGFDVKRVDEYHLTGVQTEGLYVGWEHRPGSASDGRRDSRPKPETQKREAEKKSENVQGKTRLVLEKTESVSLGQLWLELLRFYTLEFALEDYIISIRLKELLPRDAKNWPRRRLAIEDPFALKRNVARSLNSQMVFEYIQERFRMAYRYFACPQSRNGIRARRAKHRSKAARAGPSDPAHIQTPRDSRGQANRAQERDGDSSGEEEEENEEEDNDDEDDEEEEEEDLETGDEEQCVSRGLTRLLVTESGKRDTSHQTSSPSPQNGLLLDSEDEEQEEERRKVPEQSSIAPEDLHYIFDRMIFTGGKPPTVVCSICKRDGHLKDDCPEDFKKMELAPLPPMSERFREILDNLCKLCYHELSPTLGEQQKREQILCSLERFIRKEYNDKAQLCLFGSSKNGFGFRDSDLDICMTLEGHDTAEKLNCKEIIEGLAKILKKHTGLRNILPITTAKVPIVKFEHKQSGLEGDISLYNTLAQHNTRMLATYAALDPRVQLLGYTMKVFAKRCDIGDASRGSLSSYAYILMVLYFLQQRQPPVIPVLQEIYDGNTMPQRMVDGWNAFFFDDLEELRLRLSEFQKNRETVGELWLGLLRFYTEEFDFKEHVISIRQRKRLTTFEKQWTSKCIAIEDPFDLNHNLGAGVSRKMTNFIMKAFINGRKLFGTPFYPQPGMEAEYFFDSKVLTDGELAPNDRCCRICGKIGHYMKDCPKRRRMKKKENDKDEEVRDEDREPRERRCFQCGDMGHVRRDCPEYRHLRQRGTSAPVPQMVRSMVSSQAIPIPQSGVSQDRPGRTRQQSECSDTRQTPPYSPQPSSFSQSSVSPQSSQSTKPSSGSSSSAAPSKVPQPGPAPSQQQQVQLSVFGFPPSHPGQFHHALGLLQPHVQPPHGTLAPGSWPLHGPPVRKGKGNAGAGQQAGSPSAVNLNDPSIIFAQPAGRVAGVGGPTREGGHHWHNHHLNPGTLVANGTVGKAAGFQAAFGGVAPASRSWEHSGGAGSFSLSPSWAYRMPQSYLQQPNKPFISQGTRGAVANQHFPLLQSGRHVNLSYVQQKK
ncbi:terminal uridylyltransferase 4 isoform X2 [Astyanax mexicanus]|uniref:terminal uridylyltransferase 4 isoform X2 n=1 Tax=Astyanax mexicanus TaxID=7994 RepID=UPI0020CB2717|nr:terminal uridylyltransferase 4 isoform X2 [Astyanax mexicanus]